MGLFYIFFCHTIQYGNPLIKCRLAVKLYSDEDTITVHVLQYLDLLAFAMEQTNTFYDGETLQVHVCKTMMYRILAVYNEWKTR